MSTSFGEEGGRLTYGSYLGLPQLLALQEPVAEPPAHDERLFIVVHQVSELWFAQLLFELETARDLLLEGRDAWTPRHLLQRAHVVERLLVEQVAVLETMTPQDFLTFRSRLAPASGFQSVQFRELEFLSGAKDPSFGRRLRGASPDELARLERRLAEPTLWDGLLGTLSARDLPVGSAEERRDTFLAVARDRAAYGDLWDLCEALLLHDQLAEAWRSRHVTMVERQIGTKPGTGGSTGSAYLRSRVGLRYYPELWELRAAL